MKNYLIGGGLVVAFVGVFFAGQATTPQKLGSYSPSTQPSGPFVQNLATSTAFTSSNFCLPTNIIFSGLGFPATGTLPAATSTYVACTNLQSLGTPIQGSIANESASTTVNLVAGTNVTFKCETQAVGTSSQALGAACTTSQVGLGTSTYLQYTEYFDTASSDLKFIITNYAH